MIYADYAATTPIDREVAEIMTEVLYSDWGNAGSVHSYGRNARQRVEKAREDIAKVFNAEKNEIYFTSGGTESDNWALRGVAEKHKNGHIIASSVEHHAVLNTLKYLEERGFRVDYLPVDKDGYVSPKDVKNAIKDNTCLISVMTANNEIGTVQPIREIGGIAREYGIPFFTDAVQAAGQRDIDVKRDNISLLSASSHKFYGPKGIGILYIKEGVQISNLMYGGSQERDRRPGTTVTPLVVGIAEALKKYAKNRDEYNFKAKKAADKVKEIILSSLDNAYLNGGENRLAGNLNFYFEGIQAESLLLLLDLAGIACSAGAACSAGSVKLSHVISALPQRGEKAASSSLRISLSHLTTEEEAEIIGKTVVENVRKLKNTKF